MNVTEFEIRDNIYDTGYMDVNFENMENGSIEIDYKEFKLGGSRFDLLGHDDKGVVYIIEIKKGVIDEKAYVQLLSYIEEFKTSCIVNEIDIKGIRGVLVGENIIERVKTCVRGNEDVTYVEYFASFDYIEQTYTPREDYYQQTKKELELFTDSIIGTE